MAQIFAPEISYALQPFVEAEAVPGMVAGAERILPPTRHGVALDIHHAGQDIAVRAEEILCEFFGGGAERKQEIGIAFPLFEVVELERRSVGIL